MLKVLKIDVTPGGKTNRNSKQVVVSVQQGHAIPQGDIGAYIVGVFACQSLSSDGKDYDRFAKGQWKHCLYKAEWTASLQGRDEFTDEQKSLILAGAELLKRYDHGWGNQVMAQLHVRRLIDVWRKQT